MFTVELNGVQLCEPYEFAAEAEAFAAGYLAALTNNEITTDGTCEIVVWALEPDSSDGAREIGRHTYL